MTKTATTADVWDAVASPAPVIDAFRLSDVAGLPEPARQFFEQALVPDVPLAPTVHLDMHGEIKIGRWMRFTAQQVLSATGGFVWEATVGGWPIRLKGRDTYHHGTGALDFRLWGVMPVATASGPDVDRSAAGRHLAETVAWLPQTLLPHTGATWSATDSTHATVTVPNALDETEVALTFAPDHKLVEVVLPRWGNPDGEGYAEYPFGAHFHDHRRFDHVTIPTAGFVGWHWGSTRHAEGEFFRFEITHAHGGRSVPSG